MPKVRAPVPREPRAPAAGYIRRLRRIWHTTQGLIAYGLWPLLEVWDGSVARSDQKRSRVGASGVVSAYPASPTRSRAYNPLAPRPLLPRIWNLSDAEIRRIWPGLDPRDVRDFAPWAVTRGEVRRIMGQGPLAQMRDLEAFVRASIETARLAQPPGALPQIEIIPPRRPPGAFQLRPRAYMPVVLGADGLPIPVPPIVSEVTAETISRQLEWIDLATSEMLTKENIADEVALSGRQIDLFNRREMQRVLGVDVRKIPGVDMMIDQWRDGNARLIETGLRAPYESPKLRPSLLKDVSRLVENAHAQGLRVEILAHDLRERFDVSDSRAELIARDQTLKLNGQINRHRQLNAGVEEYIWDTAGDERVRESHAELDGTVQNWHAPPSVGHPGTDYQCRCIAIPVILED